MARVPSARQLELVSTVLLSLATVATAWAAYQSRQWTGEQALASSRATAARITENRTAALANRQVQIDVATFTEWLDARGARPRLADFYRARFRPEFEPAFDAWIATRPFIRGSSAPATPFDMAKYRLKATADAERLETTAAAGSERAKDANSHAADYMLAVVLSASSLFFAGISTKLQTERARGVTLGLGCLLFLVTVAWLATLPVLLSG
jgi:hypothetical protein